MRRSGPWRVLGIDPTADLGAVRRAYAEKLKALDLDREVAAYAALRAARDHALALARGRARAEEPVFQEAEPDFADFADEPADGFTYRLADFDAPEAIGFDPPTLATAQPEPPSEVERLFDELAALLAAGPEDEPFDEAGAGHARTVLAGLLDAIHDGHVSLQDDAEYRLAALLAHHWPRSAPLLEAAAEGFGWMRDAGGLAQGGAIEYVVTRLRGLRFHAKVSEPAHPLHRAWRELAKPGRKGPFGFLRASREDVRKLLAGIRERYPEVESYLDPARVDSWETESLAKPWYSAFRYAWVAIVLVNALRFCSPTQTSAPPAPNPFLQAESPVGRAERDAALKEVFGPNIDMIRLKKGWPDAASLFEAILSQPKRGGDEPLLTIVRMATQQASKSANFATLLKIKQVRLELGRAAFAGGGGAGCREFLQSSRLPTSNAVFKTTRERERALAVELLDNGLLEQPTGSPPQTFTIPGKLFAAAAANADLSHKEAERAARNQGSDNTICRFTLSLLESALSRPADLPLESLRLL